MPGFIQFSSRLFPDMFRVCNFVRLAKTSRSIAAKVLLSKTSVLRFGVEAKIWGGIAASRLWDRSMVSRLDKPWNVASTRTSIGGRNKSLV